MKTENNCQRLQKQSARNWHKMEEKLEQLFPSFFT
jgi:hypothetical protein